MNVLVVGCDDETVVEVELSPDEAQVVERVAALITAQSSYNCQPTMSLGAVPQ